MPLTISVPDSLRHSVEAATGGRQTVLYTALGQPTFMYVQPQFLNNQVGIANDSSVHPMFFGSGGTAKSQYLAGVYPGVIKNGELLSLPGQDPSHTLNHDQFVAAARACGTGFHVMTNAAYAGIALWCRANSFQPRGNTNWGASSDATWETGRRGDNVAPGTASGTGRTHTGSGPASWRHDGTHAGISDLCGNVWEWAPGMRVNSGEIQIIANNGAALNATDLGVNSTAWRAINGATGALVDPGTANTVKYAVSGTAAYTLVRASGSSFEGMTNPGTTPVHADAIKVLRAHGLFPVGLTAAGVANTDAGSTSNMLGGTIAVPATNGDGFWLNAGIEALPFRGGTWDDSADAGVFALLCVHVRSVAYDSRGARPAFVL
jgi:sulfatase modifying factor 1